LTPTASTCLFIIGQVTYHQDVEADKKSEQKEYEKISLSALGKILSER